jgi:hypothetical protein
MKAGPPKPAGRRGRAGRSPRVQPGWDRPSRRSSRRSSAARPSLAVPWPPGPVGCRCGHGLRSRLGLRLRWRRCWRDMRLDRSHDGRRLLGLVDRRPVATTERQRVPRSPTRPKLPALVAELLDQRLVRLERCTRLQRRALAGAEERRAKRLPDPRHGVESALDVAAPEDDLTGLERVGVTLRHHAGAATASSKEGRATLRREPGGSEPAGRTGCRLTVAIVALLSPPKSAISGQADSCQL